MGKARHEVGVHGAIFDRLCLALPPVAARTLIHIPNGEKRSEETGRLLKRLGTRPGAADLMFVWAGRAHFLEVKTGSKAFGIRKTYLRADQRQFGADVTAAGAAYGVARSSDEAIALCREWGVPLREAPVQGDLLAGAR